MSPQSTRTFHYKKGDPLLNRVKRLHQIEGVTPISIREDEEGATVEVAPAGPQHIGAWLTQTDIEAVLQSLLRTVRALHEVDLFHGDLQLENLEVAPTGIRLSGFSWLDGEPPPTADGPPSISADLAALGRLLTNLATLAGDVWPARLNRPLALLLRCHPEERPIYFADLVAAVDGGLLFPEVTPRCASVWHPSEHLYRRWVVSPEKVPTRHRQMIEAHIMGPGPICLRCRRSVPGRYAPRVAAAAATRLCPPETWEVNMVGPSGEAVQAEVMLALDEGYLHARLSSQAELRGAFVIRVELGDGSRIEGTEHMPRFAWQGMNLGRTTAKTLAAIERVLTTWAGEP